MASQGGVCGRSRLVSIFGRELAFLVMELCMMLK
jgi:hypothetical protein